MKMKKVLSILIVCLLLLSALAGTVKAADFALNKDTLEISVGQTYTLGYSGATGDVTYTSSNSNVATVDSESRVITGVGAGTATITATDGTGTDTCEVTVNYYSLRIGMGDDEFVTSVKLVAKDGSNTKQLKAIAKDFSGEVIANPSVTWTSADSTIATVSSSGLVTAKKEGTTTVTLAGGGKEASVEIRVAADLSDVTITESQIKVKSDGPKKTLTIENVTGLTGSSFYLVIQNTKTEPQFTTLDELKALSGYTYLTYNQSEKTLTCSDAQVFTKYYELNKDMYLYIYQSDVIFSNVEFKLIGDGLKVTKEAEPGYLDAFSESTMLNYSGAHITTTFIHSNLNENRHMTVKVGKISNKTILSNLKNDIGTGLQQLLKFAKEDNSALANKSVPIEYDGQPSNFFWYINANDTLGITNDKLADNGYYYLYVVGDTENGKYITQEGITFAQASVYSENQDHAWYMFFYGSGDFKWNIPDGGDPTVVNDKTLPQTGITHPFIAASTLSLVILTVIAYTYTKRNRDIR